MGLNPVGHYPKVLQDLSSFFPYFNLISTLYSMIQHTKLHDAFVCIVFICLELFRLPTPPSWPTLAHLAVSSESF